MPKDICDLTGEITILRELIAKAKSNGQDNMANTLITTLTKCVREYDHHRLRHDEFVTKDKVVQFAQGLIGLIEVSFKSCEGYEERIDQVRFGIDGLFERLDGDEVIEVKRLQLEAPHEQ